MNALQKKLAVQSESGFVMFAVLIALVVVASVGLMLTTESAMEADRSGRNAQARQADYLASAAMEHAIWQHNALTCGGDFSLGSMPFDTHSYEAASSGGGSSTRYTLPADQDAWIDSDDPDRNRSSGAVHIRYESGITEQALYRFDLKSLPAGARIHSASAKFFVRIDQEHPEGSIWVHPVTADWLEDDVTWNSFDSAYESSVIGMITAQDTAGVWVSVNLTAQVQAWVNGQPNYGVLLASKSEGVHTHYESKEAGSSERPYLEVVVGSAPATPVNITATGTLANGITRKRDRVYVSSYQAPTAVTFQLGTDPGIDAMLNSFYSSRNYGGHELQVSVGSGSTIERGLLQFDLSAIPPGSRIVSAQLELYHYVTVGTPTDPGVDVHRISRSWVEGTKAGTGSADGATWYTWDGFWPWTSPGGQYEEKPVASSAITGATNDWERWEIGNLVQGWIDGSYPNHGLLLNGTGVVDISFASKEDADTARRPKLTITYACECGTVCSSPKGTGTVLMSVINPTTLVPADAWKKALFESWGYTVSIISESANQSSYDAAVATSDVAFISETVNSNGVGSKLENAAIGVVSQDGDYNGDLGFSSGSSWTVSPELTVTDSSHYITQVFASGPLDIYSGSMEQLTVSGSQAAGLTTLAETGGTGSLTALESGATMSSGGTAAGRRVMLPFGRESNLSWQYLNGNGLVMLQRAIAWAMGATTATVPGPEILFVSGGYTAVTDTGNGLELFIVPTAQEQLRISLFESWGYQVSLILPAQDQAAFDAALATSAIVFVSGEADATQIGSKLTATSVGVVNGQIALHDELGFSSSAGTNAFDKIVVENNSHSITDGFATSWLTITTSSQTLQALDGTLAPGLQMLATAWINGANYKDSLALLDTGAALYSGGIAAGRRAQLPWGSSGFDFNALNANGRTILQRALEWAAGLDTGSEGSTIILAIQSGSQTLGGLTFTDKDLADYDAATDAATLFFDGDSLGLANDVDAAHVLANGRIVLSAINTISLGGVTAENEDLVVYDPVSDTGSLLFDGSALFTSGSTDISAVHIANNARILLTNEYSATLGGLAFEPEDIIEYNRDTNTAAMFLDGSTVGLSAWINAVHLLDSGNIILSTDSSATLGGLSFSTDDLIEYDPVNDTATLYFDGDSRFAGTGENVRAVHITGGSDAPTGPIAHWMLDDGTGFTAIDSEGGHDGTLTTGGPVWVAGQLGDALDFDGVDDAIIVPNANTLSLTQAMTFAAWVRSDAFGVSGAYDLVISKGTVATSYAYYFGALNDEIIFGFSAGGTYREFVTPSLNLATGTWHHIAATFDNASDQVRLYHNGVEVLAATTTYEPSATTHNLYIGSSEDGADWDGILDDVRIYNRALDAGEIAELDAMGGAGPGNPIDGGGGVAFQSYADASLGNNSTSLSVTLPAGTAAGDLLIAAVATDGNEGSSLSPPAGWTVVSVGEDSPGRVTLGVWWKIATISEPSQYTFNWGSNEQAYGWIMRFTGHDASSPIIPGDGANGVLTGNSGNPTTQRITTTEDSVLVLRLGGFDDDDITAADPGLPGHTAITMGESGTGNSSASGGAGYFVQDTAGVVDLAYFALTGSEEYRSITLGIRPE